MVTYEDVKGALSATAPSRLYRASSAVALPDGTGLAPSSTCRDLDTGVLWVWTGSAWSLLPDSAAGDQALLRQAVDASSTRTQLLILRELRRIALLLAQAQGASAFFEPLPELDSLTTG